MADNFSRYDVHAVAGSRYCYPDTSVLKNRFGLKDAVQLKKVEADISAVRQNDFGPGQLALDPAELPHVGLHGKGLIPQGEDQ